MMSLAQSLHGNIEQYMTQLFRLDSFLLSIAFISAWHTFNNNNNNKKGK